MALSLGPTVSNSFARFAYALVLPAMRDDLALSFSLAGLLNTSNALGYLLGAILTRLLVQSWGNKVLFHRGMLLTVLAVLVTGWLRDVTALAVCRLLAGVGGAAVFICGGALAGNIVAQDPKWSTRCITIYFGGAGLGLLLSGVLIPWWLARYGVAAWPDVWWGMGGLSAGMTLVAAYAVNQIDEPTQALGSSHWPLRPMLPAFISYTCFGLGYIVYMTFIVAWVKTKGASTATVMLMWSALAIATLIAPLVWSAPLTHWRGGRAMASVMMTLGVGALLPVLPFSEAWLTLATIVSATLFGLGMFSVPASVSALIKQALPKPAWGAAMATFTIAFSLSQMVAPLLGGWVADMSGTLRSGLSFSAAVVLLGALIACLQRETRIG